MSRRTVVVLPGDGIGRAVTAEAVRVLEASGFDAEYVAAEIGWGAWRRDGDPLPARTIELLEAHRLGLLGAVGSKGREEAEAELPERLRGRGRVYRSPILSLRQRFGLDVGFRPATTLPGNPLNFVRRGRDGGIEEPRLDLAVFRQNTEGLYAGVEWLDPPAEVRRALGTHPRFAPFAGIPGADLAVGLRVVTREACRRIADAAFRHAAATSRSTVTLCEKPNVLRETGGLVVEAAREVQRGFPGIKLDLVNVDALVMELIRRPEELGVIVATNMFGDIVSDAVAGLTGGLGFACGANLGDDLALFEPTHGSAPRHDGIDPSIANPCAAILAGALLADHAGDADAARRIRGAVAGVVAEGRVRTYDMLKLRAGGDAVARGAATTRGMGDAVVARL